jgi:hypothetical protein
VRFRLLTGRPPIGKERRYPTLELTAIHADERGAPWGRFPGNGSPKNPPTPSSLVLGPFGVLEFFEGYPPGPSPSRPARRASPSSARSFSTGDVFRVCGRSTGRGSTGTGFR